MNKEKYLAQARKSLAKSLREFGYPDATPENATGDWLFAQFSLSQLKEARDEMKTGPRDCLLALDELIAECEASKAAGPGKTE